MAEHPIRGHRALRRGRTSLPGQVHVLTTVTHARTRWFDDVAVACAVARVHRRAAAFHDARLLCWVLMPDHWHGVVEVSDTPLATLMLRFKTLSAHAAHSSGIRAGPVWSRSFHDRALRRGDDVVAACRYVVANPLRAGLVDQIGCYPFWDAVWLDSGSVAP